ncbi:MAG TPA: class I SAM-dependent methyltransferase [Solirubrobacterales bacterium]|jgi:ubiquinone/menaquinone biosynthesis C-methylase UbiE|nr:class I SAM-dependent methyltransferase [Solirubrobacterales bacterium]
MSSPPPLTPLAAAVLHVGAPERALEIACGDGDGALFLAREFPSARVRGIDADPDRVAAASRRVGLDPEGRIAFKLGGPRRIPYPDDNFDLVAAVDARPAAGEVARVLRPGGHLILAATRGAAAGRGSAAWLLARGLRARRFETLAAARAGAGSFSVLRLPGP